MYLFLLIPHAFIKTSRTDNTAYNDIFPLCLFTGATMRYSDSLTMPTQSLSLSLAQILEKFCPMNQA